MPFCCNKIKSAVWELTLKCNANCIHCGSSAGTDRKNNLTFEEAKDLIRQLVDENCESLTLIGGEYFVYPYWKELLSELSKTSLKLSIVTNGLLLSDKNLDFLMKNKIQSIGISLDGSNSKTHDHIRRVSGCFDKAFDAIKRSRGRKIPTTVITTVNSLNIKELKDLRSLLIENKMRSWQLQHANIFGRMCSELSLDDFGFYIVGLFCAQTLRLYPKEKIDLHAMHCMGYYSQTIPNHTLNRFWRGCFAGKTVLGIRSNGDILGCLSLYDDRFVEGNIRDSSLKGIRHSRNFCNWNHRLKKFKSLTGFCKDCPYSLICLGGCASYENFQHHCYYEIEQKMLKLNPTNDFEQLFKDITLGHMDSQGHFFLKNGKEITEEYIETLAIDDNRKKQLSILIIDN